MKIPIILIVFVVFLGMSCDETKNEIEIGISDVLHRKTFFTDENCNTDYYNNIIIRNDTLFVDGKLKNQSGNFLGIINKKESENISSLINKINPKSRMEKSINPTTGMTALLLKENGKTLDSIVDLRIEWNSDDTNLFNYIGELICQKNMIEISDSIYYPTWEMVKPPE
jgi:hypothetical protein